MDEDDERGSQDVGLGRTLALSDGIFAISMTLLAFQIQPPDLPATKPHQLAHALAALSDRYYVYVLSFSVIGFLWLFHHRLFRNIARSDEALMVLNLAFLMVVAALPFPSAVLGRYGGESVADILYAGTMATAATLLTGLTILALRRQLTFPTSNRATIRNGMWRAASAGAVFVLSIPVAVVAPKAAPFTWIATAFVRLLPGRRARRASAESQE